MNGFTELFSFPEMWGIVNNAGIFGPMGPLEFLTKHSFRDVFEVNFFGMVDVTKTFLPLVKESHGRIVNMASIAAISLFPFSLPYSASKCAVSGFTSILRLVSGGCTLYIVGSMIHGTYCALYSTFL